jgi:hypothetical protein
MSFLSNVCEWFENLIAYDEYIEVTVVKGDRLWDICEKASGATTNAEIQHHVDVVKFLNPDMDPDMIHEGDTIKLPRNWG